MPLQIHTEASDANTLTLALDGRLDAQTAPELDAYTTSRVDPAVSTLIFNLGKLSFISSAGLRVLARTRKSMQAREGRVLFYNASPQVQKVFDIVKAVPLQEVFTSEAELDLYLMGIQQKLADSD